MSRVRLTDRALPGAASDHRFTRRAPAWGTLAGMAHTHRHGSDDDAGIPPRVRRALLLLVLPFVLATAAGLALLWPGTTKAELDPAIGAPADLLDAEVVAVEQGPCAGTPEEVDVRCTTPSVRILEGPDQGATIDLAELSEGIGVPQLEPGDRVVLGFYPDAPEGFQYAFADRERRTPLYLLAGLFAVAVIALGRLSGLRALAGLTVSLVVLSVFVLPAILEGSNPLAVALTGSAVIAFAALYITHGVSARTTAAVLGTLASLVLVGVLAAVFVDLTQLSGLADEEATFLRVSAAQVDLRGLLLGGIVIGALGVLDDVTVTQVSAVWELHAANPTLGRLGLYRAAVRIGRDHIASTVNTLVLAYAGASLPLFLLFSQAEQELVDVLNGEVVAVEVVRTLAGSIGLVASVPLTTALAALAVTSLAGGGAAEVRPRRAAERRGRVTAGGGTPPDEPDEPAEPTGEPATPTVTEPPRRSKRARPSDPRRFRTRGEERFWRDDE